MNSLVPLDHLNNFYKIIVDYPKNKETIAQVLSTIEILEPDKQRQFVRVLGEIITNHKNRKELLSFVSSKVFFITLNLQSLFPSLDIYSTPSVRGEYYSEFYGKHTKLYQKFDFSPDNKGQVFTSITGDVQSGKTTTALILCHYSIMWSTTPVFVIMDREAGRLQVEERIQIYNQQLRDFCMENKFFYDGPVESIFVESKNKKRIVDNFIKNVKKAMIIVFGNYSRLKKLNDILAELENNDIPCPYNLILDEVDYQYKSVNAKVYTEMDTMIKQASTVTGISATIFNFIYSQSGIKTNRIFELETHPSYRGIPDIERFCNVDDGIFTPSATEEWRVDTGFIPMIDDISNLPPYKYKDNIDGKSRVMPNIVLYRNSDLREHQEAIAEYMKDRDWCTIVFNGNGLSLFHPELKDPVIYIKGYSIARQEGGTYKSKDISISSLLSYIRNRYESETIKNHHLLIITGRLLCRQISYTDSEFIWHPTHMRLLVSKGATDCTLLNQDMRLCGKFPRDNIPIKLSVNDSAWQNIQNSYRLQKQMNKKSIECDEVKDVKHFIFGETEFDINLKPKVKLHKNIPKKSVVYSDEVSDIKEVKVERYHAEIRIYLSSLKGKKKLTFDKIYAYLSNKPRKIWYAVSKCFDGDEYTTGKHQQRIHNTFKTEKEGKGTYISLRQKNEKRYEVMIN